MFCCIKGLYSFKYCAEVKKKLVAEIKTMKMGSVEDFTNFINAVIDEKSFDKLEGYIKACKKR